MDRFVNLHSHTAGSHLDAIIRVSDLFKKVFELGQTAIAITDHGNMSMIWSAYEEYKKYKAAGKNIKFIPGNEIYFVEDLNDPKSKRRHLVLLAKNEVGYKNLLKITAAGYRNSVSVMAREFPRVDEKILRQFSEGLYATSACGGSLVAAAIFGGDQNKAKAAATLFRSIFGDRFFIELQPHSMSRDGFSQVDLNNALKNIAEELGIKMVGTCDSHYLTSAHEKYHDMILAISAKKPLDDPDRHRYATFEPCLVCKGSGVYPVGSEQQCHGCFGTKGRVKPCAEFYLKTGQQVHDYFAKHYGSVFADEIITTCEKIGADCEPPDYMEPKDFRLPTFPWQTELDVEDFQKWKAQRTALAHLSDDAIYLRFRVWKKFKEFTKDFSKSEQKKYWERACLELDILEGKNFSSYILIVADYVNWAKTNGVAVGAGRGSVGGVLIAHLLGIHAADPIKFGLLFERFQNRQKASVPDIDIDFAPSGREKVIDYIKQKYGEDKVAAISNISKLTPKIIVKDVARSLCLGGSTSTAFQIANETTADIPDIVKDANGNSIKVDTMEKALTHSNKLRRLVHQYPEVLDYANNLVGLPKTFATHAAGIIIADVPLDEYVPLRRDKDGVMSVQYDKDTCETVKLVKMDFLGLETLDVLAEARVIAKQVGIELPVEGDIQDGDALTYKLIQGGHLAGVFQLDGSLTSLCKKLKPMNVQDIALVNAIGRPGVENSEKELFISRKFGKEKTKYAHPILEAVLNATYGISVYEEVLLQIAQHVAGWDLSEADGLRKLTKAKEKGLELAEKLEKKFVADAQKHSKLSQKDAQLVWDKAVASFAAYGFNKSHAILYSMISYQTAYYKAHAPGPYLCAVLNSETRSNKLNKQETIDALKRDCAKFGIKISTCDINLSRQYYTMKDSKTIITGLGAIKGIGEKALDAIIAHQPYASFEDFLRRTPSSTVNKGIIIALAKAGAFDSFGISRKFAAEQYGDIRNDLSAYIRKLGLTEEEAIKSFSFKGNVYRQNEWTFKDKLLAEKEVLGEYVSGRAEDIFPNFFKGGIYAQSFSKIKTLPKDSNFNMEGVIVAIREIVIKKPGKLQGKIMAKLTVENINRESTEVTIWPDTLVKFSKYIKTGVPLRGLFKISEFQGNKSLTVVNLEAVYYEEKTNALPKL